MKISENTVLITGGATGIGLALAELFAKAGNQVVICGRRQGRLDEAERRIPGLRAMRCDIADNRQREALYEWTCKNFNDVNILVNNAGIQRPVDFNGRVDGDEVGREIEVNFRAQIDLSARFIRPFLKREEAAIVNVSSGLGFVPIAAFPLYCATKAAIHSFSISLRHQLKQSSVKVFEVIPPIVHDTELKGKFLERNQNSVAAAEVANAVIKGMKVDEYEIAIGPARNFVNGTKAEREQSFVRMNH
jgi:uncharacterized oxidoreductase